MNLKVNSYDNVSFDSFTERKVTVQYNNSKKSDIYLQFTYRILLTKHELIKIIDITMDLTGEYFLRQKHPL